MSILNRVFGDSNLLNLDEKIKTLITKIPSHTSSTSSDDNTGNVIDKFLEGDFKQTEISKLFQEVSVPQERIARYNVYDEVNKGIPLIRRILKVYLSNILPKNPVTGKSIIYRKTNKQGSDEHVNYQEKSEALINEILTKYDLIKKLKDQILPKQLLYGDIFVEIISLLKEQTKVDLNSQTNITGTNVLLESNNLKNVLIESQNLLKEVQTISDNDFVTRIDSTLNKLSDLIVDCNDDILHENVLSSMDNVENNDNDPDEIKLSSKYKKALHDVLIRIHKPHNIVILETKYGSTIGYLEVSKKVESGDMSVGQNLSQVVDKITNVGKRTDFNQEKIVNKLIFYILRKVVNNQMKKVDPSGTNKTDVDTVVQSLGPDVYAFIKKIFVEQGIYKKENQVSQMRVKFIPASSMIHFSNTSNDYAPYGESLIEGLILPSKLYMLAQLANTISKLSRASVIRKWTIDVGSSQMHSQLIQKIKRELYNTRVTLEDLSSFKSIPKIMSDFKDMFVLAQNGKTPLDVEVQSLGDASVKTADIEDSRREIIALSGVPSSHLGYSDMTEMRESLVHSNVSFATEITNMQEDINKNINKMIDSIANILDIGYKPSDYVTINLIPPVVLILQLIEMTLTSIGSISSTFTNLQIPIDPYYFLEQYVPHIQWDEFREAAIKKATLDKSKVQMSVADPTTIQQPQA